MSNTQWTFKTLEDAYKPRPPLQYAIDGLFPEASLSIVYGAPGCLKTLLLIDAMVCVVSGKRWLPNDDGKGGQQTIRGPCILLDFDNGERPIAERLEAAGKRRSLPDDAPLWWVSLPSPWLDLTNVRFVRTIIQDLNTFDPKMIVVDNLGNVSGGADENSPDMTDVMSSLRLLAEKTQAAIVVVHHQRKSTGMSSRPGDALRGHSSIEAAIDLALHVDRKLGSDETTITATKTRFAPVEQFGAKFNFLHKPGTRELSETWFTALDVLDVTSNKAIERVALEVVRKNPGTNQTDLIDEMQEVLEVGRKKIRDKLADMENNGDIFVQPGQHNANLYFAPQYDPFHAAWWS